MNALPVLDPAGATRTGTVGEGIARLVRLRLDPARLWRWQLWLAQALAARPGTRVEVEFAAGRPLPTAVLLLLTLEGLLFAPGGDRATDLISREAFAVPRAHGGGTPDLVIDLAGPQCAPPRSGAVLRPLYCGRADDLALVAALLAGREVDLAFAGRPGQALPAIHSRTVLSRDLDTVFGALLRWCLRESEAVGGAPAAGEAPPPPSAAGLRPVAGYLLGAARQRAADRLAALCRRAPRWRVGWRRLDGDGIAETRQLPAGGYRVLADDGRRYYADPFVLSHGGRRTLFVEEFPYATGRGLISAAAILDDGTVAAPRPALELGVHASYPFVFHHGGEVWMVPETAAARRVELFRAVRLPDRWESAATLLDGEDAADVTLARHGGLWWMFAASRALGSSDRDTLCLYSARDPLGPWTPHPANPVLIDRRAARPAGALYRSGGGLWRPAQDASAGYGSALSLCRIDALTPDVYAQTLVASIQPGPSWPGQGIHTLNTGGGLEVVDGRAAADAQAS